MKLSHVLLAAAAASALLATSAHAQSLTWYGTSACFANAVASTGSGNGATLNPGNCGFSNSQTSSSISWDNGESRQSEMSVSISEDDLANLPGGMASNANSNRTLSFGATGQTFAVYLSYFQFDKASSSSSYSAGESLSSVDLNYKLAFNGGSVDYSGMFNITAYEQSGPDGISMKAGLWKNFDVNGQSYSFRIFALDNYSNNDSPQQWINPNKTWLGKEDIYTAEQMYCADGFRDEVLSSTATNFSSDFSRKICGEVRWNGSSQPSTSTVAPEPSTYALMTAGLVGIFGVARRRRNKQG